MTALSSLAVRRSHVGDAIEGRLAEVPLTISYQPRWWMHINLALADDVDSPLVGALDQ
jgi:hypothetical protein